MNAHSRVLRSDGSPLTSQQIICWTRMQTEAGQDLDNIFARKEVERHAGAGVFFWGVGNPPARAIANLAEASIDVPVIFSVMKSKPKLKDVKPSRVLAWRRFVDLTGTVCSLPAHALVTSRANSRSAHYALVCKSFRPLAHIEYGTFNPDDWRNLSRQGKPIGPSQVTALLRRVGTTGTGTYTIAFEAQLTGSYWVKLVDPVEVSLRDRVSIANFKGSIQEWLNLCQNLKRPGEASRNFNEGRQLGFFD